MATIYSRISLYYGEQRTISGGRKQYGKHELAEGLIHRLFLVIGSIDFRGIPTFANKIFANKTFANISTGIWPI
jgi:hypothetical protein